MKDSWNNIEGVNTDELLEKVKVEREKFDGIAEIYPKEEDTFRCFSYFEVQDTKVVI